jgi:hypothetical protein
MPGWAVPSRPATRRGSAVPSRPLPRRDATRRVTGDEASYMVSSSSNCLSIHGH